MGNARYQSLSRMHRRGIAINTIDDATRPFLRDGVGKAFWIVDRFDQGASGQIGGMRILRSYLLVQEPNVIAIQGPVIHGSYMTASCLRKFSCVQTDRMGCSSISGLVAAVSAAAGPDEIR
jgi:hypothetical protein